MSVLTVGASVFGCKTWDVWQLGINGWADVSPSWVVAVTLTAPATRRVAMEQVTGFEPALPAWKAGVLATTLYLHFHKTFSLKRRIITSKRFANLLHSIFRRNVLFAFGDTYLAN